VIIRGLFTLLLALWTAWQAVAAQPDTAVVAPVDPAKVIEQQTARRQALERDRETVERTRQELQTQIADLPWQMESLRPEQIGEALVEQTAVDVKSALLHQETAATELNNAERRIQELQKTITDLEAREQLLKNPAKDVTDGVSDRAAQLQQTSQMLAQQRAELELESLNLANLRAQGEVAKLRLNLTTQWQERVERMYRQRQEQSRQDAQAELISRLQTDLTGLQDRADALKQRLVQERSVLPVAAWQRLETELRTLEEQINLRTQDRYLAEVSATLARLNDLLKKTEASPAELQQALEQLETARTDLRRADELLQQKTTVYAEQRQVIERRDNLTGVSRRLRDEELQLIDRLLTELSQRTDRVQNQAAQLDAVETRLTQYYQERRRQDLFTRKPYPDSAEAWGQLWQELTTVPQVLFYQVRLSGESALKAMLDEPLWRWLSLIALEAT